MKQVYILRHAPKDNETGELTEAGRKKAHEVKHKLPTFHKVIASPSSRTQETAEILTGTKPHIDVRAGHFRGTAEQEENLKMQAQLHPLGFPGAVFETSEIQDEVKKVAEGLIELIHTTLEQLGENEQALIVSHDITIVPAEKLLLKQQIQAPFRSFAPLSGYIVNETGDVMFVGL